MKNEIAFKARNSDFNYVEFPLIQILKNGDYLTVKAEIPGISSEELDLAISDDVLTISGEIKSAHADNTVQKLKILKQERKTGKFQRTIELPFAVESDQAEAVFKNGILTITLPVKEAVKAKKITVKSE